MDYKLTETDIIRYSKQGNVEKINFIESAINKRIQELNYIMSRFLDDFSEKIETDQNCYRFNKVKNEEYSNLNRLLRVIKAYKK
jgi:cell shape-determining protein MreC